MSNYDFQVPRFRRFPVVGIDDTIEPNDTIGDGFFEMKLQRDKENRRLVEGDGKDGDMLKLSSLAMFRPRAARRSRNIDQAVPIVPPIQEATAPAKTEVKKETPTKVEKATTRVVEPIAVGQLAMFRGNAGRRSRGVSVDRAEKETTRRSVEVTTHGRKPSVANNRAPVVVRSSSQPPPSKGVKSAPAAAPRAPRTAALKTGPIRVQQAQPVAVYAGPETRARARLALIGREEAATKPVAPGAKPAARRGLVRTPSAPQPVAVRPKTSTERPVVKEQIKPAAVGTAPAAKTTPLRPEPKRAPGRRSQNLTKEEREAFFRRLSAPRMVTPKYGSTATAGSQKAGGNAPARCPSEESSSVPSAAGPTTSRSLRQRRP